MPVPDKVYLSTPSDTSTSALGITGELREHIHATYGKQYYRMVKNTSGSSIAANLCVAFITSGATTSGSADATAGSSEEIALCGTTDPAVTIAGITQNSIADGSYGWVVCGGDCLATSAGVVDVSTLAVAISYASGKLDDSSISGKEHAIVGVFQADTAGSATVRVRIAGLI
jgi:hypothetical protein